MLAEEKIGTVRRKLNRIFLLPFLAIIMSHVCLEATPHEAGRHIECDGHVFKNYRLWGPYAGNDAEWIATKWKNGINYIIKDDTSNPAAANELKNSVAKYFSEFEVAAGLEVHTGKAELSNVVIVISDNITESDLKLLDQYKSLVRAAMGDVANAETIVAFHHNFVAQMTPRCGGSIAFNKKEGIVGAFVYIQTGQNQTCPILATAEAFGLGNLRDDSMNRNVTMPEFEAKALAAAAEQYDPHIEHGMSKDESLRAMREFCK